MDDDGDVLAARPDRLYEVRPQERVLRRTVKQNVDVFKFPFLDVLKPQKGNQLVEVLRKIEVIDVPKIFPVSVPQRRVESRPPQSAEQLVEVPTEPVYVLMVLASKVYSRRELSRLLSGQGSTASGSRVEQLLRVGGGVLEVFKVYALNRIQQQRTWSRSLIFLHVAVFKVSPQARDQVVDIPVMAQTQIPMVVFPM